MSCALPSAVEKLGHQLFQDRHLTVQSLYLRLLGDPCILRMIAQSLYLRLLGDPPQNQTAKPVRPRSALQMLVEQPSNPLMFDQRRPYLGNVG